MTSLLLTALLLLIGICIFLERRSRSLTTMLWLLIFFYIWMPLFLEHTGVLNNFHPQDIETAVQVSVLFSLSYALAFFLSNPRSIYAQARKPTLSMPPPSRRLSSAIIVLILLILIAFGVGPGQILSSNWLDKSRLGIFAVVILWLLAILSGQLLLCLRHRHFGLAFAILIVFAIVAAYYRSRGVLGLLLIPFIVYYLRVDRIRYTIISLLASTLIIAAIVLRFIRFQGELGNVTIGQLAYQLSGGVLEETFSSGDLSVYQYFIILTKECSVYLDCFRFTFLARFAELLGLSDAETVRLEYYLYDNLVAEGVKGSLHPTLFGYVYGDFGWLGGCLFMAVLALAHSRLSRLNSTDLSILIGFLSSYILFVARGSVFNATVDLVVGLGILVVSKRLLTARPTRTTIRIK